MKAKLLIAFALIAWPLAGLAQSSSSSSGSSSSASAADADAKQPFYRYEVYAGYGYSSANQVKGAGALTGPEIQFSAKANSWFGAMADGGFYTGIGHIANATGTASESTILAGPQFVIHAAPVALSAHVLFGGAHTGGQPETPNISFAWAIGSSLDYELRAKWAVRITGGAISSAFVSDPTNQGYSPNRRWNPRVSAGLVYHF